MKKRRLIPWRLGFLGSIIVDGQFWRRYFEELAQHGKVEAVFILLRSFSRYSNPKYVKTKPINIDICDVGTIPLYTFSDFSHFLELFVFRTYGLEDMEPPRTVFDVGANVGMFVLRIKKLYPKAEVVAFEPVRSNFKRLQENLLGRMDGVTLHNFAVSNKDGTADIYLHPINSGAHSLFASQVGDDVEKETIQIRDINPFILGISNGVDLLKLDCEGAEFEIIMGLTHENAQRINRIVIEPTSGLYDREKMLDQLIALGFTHYFAHGLLIAQRR